MDNRKTVLRMIPYGLYVLTAKAKDGRMVASSISWVTQASFEPPLIALAVKVDSETYTITKEAGEFAINFLDKDQKDIAFKFFKHQEPEGDSIGGEPLQQGALGIPLLANGPASLECKVIEIIEKGDHHIFLAEIINVELRNQPEGRPDDSSLKVKDLGDKMFYGG